MGFLRKVGRKIKKGVKKLFSSKFGALIGSIGLSMMLGPVISRAFNGIKGFFTKGAVDTTAGQITTTAATSAGGTTQVRIEDSRTGDDSILLEVVVQVPL